MAIDRFLGAGWASVHGPADPGATLTWTLDHGFRGLLPAPAPRPVDWRGMHRRIQSLPFRFPAVRVSPVQGTEPPVEAGLASTREADRSLALAAIEAGVAFARQLGCGTVILQPGGVPVAGEVAHRDLADPTASWTPEAAAALRARGHVRRDAALETFCRALHRLCKGFPEMTFCLGLSRDVLSLGEPGALAAVFDDLARYRLGYWHDTVAAACRERFLSEDPGRVLEDCSKTIQGITLGDHGDGESYLPPGAGGVDYPLLSAYRPPSASQFPVVIELDPGVKSGEIPGIHAYLDKFGL
jgi:hypothetical protein